MEPASVSGQLTIRASESLTRTTTEEDEGLLYLEFGLAGSAGQPLVAVLIGLSGEGFETSQVLE